MPFARPTLTTLTGQVAADIIAALPPGAAPLLRFNNLGILGRVLARLVNGLYGYLAAVARQATPFTADDPAYMAAWAGLRGASQKAAVAASGVAPIAGTNGALVPAGTALIRGDGATFATTADVVVASGVASCPVTAAMPGAAGNTAAGAVLTLVAPIVGASSTVTLAAALTGGLDAETAAAFRSRYLARFAAPAQGGSRDDYVAWALALPQVTRAWVRPGQLGTASVYVFVMLDVANVASGGFPVGTNGVAAAELRSAPATGDQLAVANAILPLQPAEATVFVVAPVAAPVNLTIAGLAPALQAKVAPAVRALFTAEATPGGVYLPGGGVAGVLPLAHVWQAIRAATGSAAFTITAPTVDIVADVGRIATLGAVSFS